MSITNPVEILEVGPGLVIEVDDGAGQRVLRMVGELDLATSAAAARAIESAAAGRTRLCLDLSGLTFCDVAGASALDGVEPRLRARGCRLAVRGAGGPLRLLLAAERLFPRLRASTRPDAS